MVGTGITILAGIWYFNGVQAASISNVEHFMTNFKSIIIASFLFVSGVTIAVKSAFPTRNGDTL
jgi:hypothetical protein